jgi:hypothetical protein
MMRKVLLVMVMVIAAMGAAPAWSAVKPAAPRIVPPTPPRIVAPTPPKFCPGFPFCKTQVPVTEPVTLTLEGRELILRTTNLTPGSMYKAVFVAYGVGYTTGYYYGVSNGLPVKDDGTYQISVDIGDLEWALERAPGGPYELDEVYAYLYDVDYNTPVTNRDGVVMRAEWEAD